MVYEGEFTGKDYQTETAHSTGKPPSEPKQIIIQSTKSERYPLLQARLREAGNDKDWTGFLEYPDEKKAALMASLQEVLAYRPTESSQFAIAEIDKTFNQLAKPADPKELERIIQQVKEHGYDFEYHDEAETYLGGKETARLTQPLWERNIALYNARFITSPEQQIQNLKKNRSYLTVLHTAYEAAVEARAQVSRDASEDELQKADEWVDTRKKWLDIAACSEGVDRTFEAFGGVTNKEEFSKQTSEFMDWIEQTKGRNIDPSTREIVTAINDFITTHFSWVNIYGPVRSNVHDEKVWYSALPFTQAANRWWDLYERQSRLKAVTKGYDAQTKLESMSFLIRFLPKAEQSAYRRERVKEIHGKWLTQMVDVAKTARGIFDAAAEGSMLTPTQVQQVYEAFENGSLLATFSPRQRVELVQTIALLGERAQAIKQFTDDIVAQQGGFHKFESEVAKKLIPNYAPQDFIGIRFRNPLAIELFPSTDDEYNRLADINKATNSGGFYNLAEYKGKKIPFIVMRPSLARNEDLMIHEKDHAFNALLPHSRPQVAFSENPSIKRDDKKRLEQINQRNTLMRAKDEISAFIAGGSDFQTIDYWLTQDALYDYHQKERVEFGFSDASHDSSITEARKSYVSTVKRSLEIAKQAQADLGLDTYDLAILLSLLPLEQWKHLEDPTKKYK